MAEDTGATTSYVDVRHPGLVCDPTSVTRVIEPAATSTE